MGLVLPDMASPGDKGLGALPKQGKYFPERRCVLFPTSQAQEEKVVRSVEVQRCFYLLFALKEQNPGWLSNSELVQFLLSCFCCLLVLISSVHRIKKK